MQIFIPKEDPKKEPRVPMIPSVCDKLVKLEADVVIETGLGETLGFTDEDYTKVGASVSKDAKKSLGEADMILRLNKPSQKDAKAMKEGAILISYLDPFGDFKLLETLAKAGVNAMSMEMMPRTTIAQKMDSISSQANLAGYMAVIVGAQHTQKILPMMMTPAGTISPARVFIIGAGVAGLQAIATAKRMGARVEAFDTRPVVEEQVKSLGAKFVKVDLGDTGETKDGYAKQLTEEQLQKQQDAMAKVCAQSDIVITTAKLFGRKAPVIIKKEMVEKMKPGAVIVDLAAETGGNVEGSKVDEVVNMNGVKIVGMSNMEGEVPESASLMYASNLYNFVSHFWDKEEKKFNLNKEDEIIQGSMITDNKEIVHQMIKDRMEKEK